MSGYTEYGQPAPKSTDPVVKFLIGCGLIAVGVIGLAVLVVVSIGWQLSRDETPGRAAEGFLLGDETSYWSFEFKPDDRGVTHTLQQVHEQAETTREQVLKNSPLSFLGSFRQRNQMTELLPLKVEFAKTPETWSGRVGFSRGTWKVRMASKMVRWFAGRGDEGIARSHDVDGVAVTTIQDPKSEGVFAFAMVGNRLVVAGREERLVRALDTSRGASGVRDPRVDALHDTVRLEGEDGWAFSAGPSVASFDVSENDDLRFRINGPAPVDARETPPADLAMARVRAFLPYFPDGAFVLDEGAPALQADGSWLISGRIPEFSKKLAAMFLRFSASRTDGPTEPREPSAIPSPPSPPTSSDPRSDTPGAPKRGESPSPAD
jgi:hypothetical protein